MSGNPQFTGVENICKRYVVLLNKFRNGYEPHVTVQNQLDISMVSVHSGSHDLTISGVMVSLGLKNAINNSNNEWVGGRCAEKKITGGVNLLTPW